MKKLLTLLTCGALITSCMSPNELTTTYIKNEIEKHSEKTVSNIAIIPLLKVAGKDGNQKQVYLELAGVKYNGEKFLIIASERKVLQKFQVKDVTETHFRKLSVKDCQEILSKTEEISDLNSDIKSKWNERNYVDYAIQKDLFLSVHRMGKAVHKEYTIWVNGKRHVIPKRTFLVAIKRFLAY